MNQIFEFGLVVLRIRKCFAPILLEQCSKSLEVDQRYQNCVGQLPVKLLMGVMKS